MLAANFFFITLLIYYLFVLKVRLIFLIDSWLTFLVSKIRYDKKWYLEFVGKVKKIVREEFELKMKTKFWKENLM